MVACWNSSSSRVVTESSASAIAEPARISRVGPAPAAGGQHQHQRRRRPARRRTPDPPAGSTGSATPNAAASDEAGTRPALTAERVRRGERVAGQRLQRGAGHAERHADETPGQQPRQPGRDQDRGGPARSRRRTAGRAGRRTPTSTVPWVRCTAASSDGAAARPTSTTDAPRRRRTGAAAGRAASRTTRGSRARAVALTSASMYCSIGRRAAEHPDAVRQLVHAALLDERQRASRSALPREAVGEHVAAVGGVGDVEAGRRPRRAVRPSTSVWPRPADLVAWPVQALVRPSCVGDAPTPARPGRTSGSRPVLPSLPSRRRSRSAAGRARVGDLRLAVGELRRRTSASSCGRLGLSCRPPSRSARGRCASARGCPWRRRPW